MCFVHWLYFFCYSFGFRHDILSSINFRLFEFECLWSTFLFSFTNNNLDSEVSSFNLFLFSFTWLAIIWWYFQCRRRSFPPFALMYYLFFSLSRPWDCMLKLISKGTYFKISYAIVTGVGKQNSQTSVTMTTRVRIKYIDHLSCTV